MAGLLQGDDAVALAFDAFEASVQVVEPGHSRGRAEGRRRTWPGRRCGWIRASCTSSMFLPRWRRRDKRLGQD